jgi:hypothetical protein
MISDALLKPRAMVVLLGARWTGKTSVINQVLADLEQRVPDLGTAYVDLRTLSKDSFNSLDALWRAVVLAAAEQFAPGIWVQNSWSGKKSYDQNVKELVGAVGSATGASSLLLCLDNVDRLLEQEIGSDFFASLRSLFNVGAYSSVIRKARWLLSSSSEPSFFIPDVHRQSPFNIGVKSRLGMFTRTEVVTLAQRYELEADPSFVDRIMRLVGGHPSLVQLVLYHWVRSPDNRTTLFEARSAGGGVFEEHMHYYVDALRADHEMSSAMRLILRGVAPRDSGALSRLESAGLVMQGPRGEFVPLCELYTEYLREHI